MCSGTNNNNNFNLRMNLIFDGAFHPKKTTYKLEHCAHTA